MPYIASTIMVGLFALTAVIFVAYDCVVARRQSVFMDSVAQTNKLVSSLFPETVRDRIMGKVNNNDDAESTKSLVRQRRSSLGSNYSSNTLAKSKNDTSPIVDFYLKPRYFVSISHPSN